MLSSDVHTCLQGSNCVLITKETGKEWYQQSSNPYSKYREETQTILFITLGNEYIRLGMILGQYVSQNLVSLLVLHVRVLQQVDKVSEI